MNTTVTLLDPSTNQPFCHIRNPKVKIERYKGGQIDLHEFLSKTNPTLWYDSEQFFDDKKRPNDETLMDIIKDKSKREHFWKCVKQINDIKRAFKMLVQRQFQQVPKNIRQRQEIIDLFQSEKYSVKNLEPIREPVVLLRKFTN